MENEVDKKEDIKTEMVVRDSISEEESKKIEKLVMAGDFGALNTTQRLQYIQMLCNKLGISWHTQPFIWITLNNKLTLYATKNCSDQLRATRKISVQIVERAQIGDVFVVRAKATMPDGREDESLGAVSTKGKSGEDLANVLMRAETKAKHRVTKSICGLSFLDETEVQDMPKVATNAPSGPRRILPAPVSVSAGSIKNIPTGQEEPLEAEYVDLATGEILADNQPTKPLAPVNLPPPVPPGIPTIKRR